ncbi:MAG: T9SS type A sorting domain-containing protein, partial [Balneola sp.]
MKRILLSFGLCLLMAGMSFGQIISQYVETNSGTTPKGVEIWNNTGGTLDFSANNLMIQKGTNGGLPSNDVTVSSGTLASGAVMVIGTSDMGTYLTNNNLSGVSYVDESFTFNGDDALVVIFGTDTTDIFGVPGTDPGSSWSGNSVDSRNQNIQLIPGLSTGITTVANAWSDPSTRFETESTDPSGATAGLDGFGVPPTGLSISGDAGWRLLSIPKASATVSDISDDTAIQGVTGGSDASASSNVFTYDNTGSYETPTNVSTAISDGYGLAVYFYNNTSNGSASLPVALDVSGSEPGTDVGVTLNKNNTAGTSSGSGAADSYYTLVGNPFASNYNLNSVTVTGGAIQDNVQFWNDGTSSYSAQNRTTPFIVSPWQAFWVEVLNANAATSITFPTSGKSTTYRNDNYFSKENPDNADIEFTLSSESSFDEAIKLSFRSYAELGMDRADASKLVPLVSEYATMSFVGEYQNEEKLKSVESLPVDLEEAITIPLRPTLVGVSGEFTFSWNGLEELSNKMSFTLHDYETGSNIDMSEVDSYVFMAEANTASKSKSVLLPVVAESESNDAENRFGITITPNTSVGIDDELDSPTKFALDQNYPNPFNPTTNIQYSVGEAGPVTITVYNVMGQKVAELLNTTKSAGSYQVSWNATGQASGIYYYR